NSIIAQPATFTQPQYLRGINISSGTASLIITNNTIANLSNTSTNTTIAANGVNSTFTHTAGMFMISTSTTGATITGNTLYNLSCAATPAASGGGTGAVVCGIGYYNVSSTSPATVSSNTIHSLVCSSASTSSGLMIGGIFFTGPAINHDLSKNFIHSLYPSATNPNVTIRGIEILGGTPVVHSNMVRLGIKPDGTSLTTPVSIYGIVKSIGTNMGI